MWFTAKPCSLVLISFLGKHCAYIRVTNCHFPTLLSLPGTYPKFISQSPQPWAPLSTLRHVRELGAFPSRSALLAGLSRNPPLSRTVLQPQFWNFPPSSVVIPFPSLPFSLWILSFCGISTSKAPSEIWYNRGKNSNISMNVWKCLYSTLNIAHAVCTW